MCTEFILPVENTQNVGNKRRGNAYVCSMPVYQPYCTRPWFTQRHRWRGKAYVQCSKLFSLRPSYKLSTGLMTYSEALIVVRYVGHLVLCYGYVRKWQPSEPAPATQKWDTTRTFIIWKTLFVTLLITRDDLNWYEEEKNLMILSSRHKYPPNDSQRRWERARQYVFLGPYGRQGSGAEEGGGRR